MPSNHTAFQGNLIIYLVPALAVIGIILFRSRAPRRLRIELLWILPLIIGLMGASYLAFVFHPQSLLDIAAAIGAAAIGVGLGWWRGKLTRIEVHPETHDVSAQVSPFGVLLLLVLFFGRRTLEFLIPPEHASQAYGWLISFGLGVLVTARLEMWLRARRLLSEARAVKTAA